ncbi:MAG: ABC transporter substrate-binding protein [Pseudomonadota bacterium]
MTTRRVLLQGLTVGIAAMTVPMRALALDSGVAEGHVEATVAELLSIVRGGGNDRAKADALKQVMQARAAMPQIARFVAGRSWRDMSNVQQAAFGKALLHSVSTIYARRFQAYAGETITLGGSTDEGRKGILVRSQVSQTSGSPVLVEWLVTDRPGRVVIADIVIEGVSLLLTQRDEVAGMLSSRGGDIDRLIADLNAV